MIRFSQPKIVSAVQNPARTSVVGYTADGTTYKRGDDGWHPFAKIVDGFSVEEAVAMRIHSGWKEIDPQATSPRKKRTQDRKSTKSFGCSAQPINRTH